MRRIVIKKRIIATVCGLLAMGIITLGGCGRTDPADDVEYADQEELDKSVDLITVGFSQLGAESDVRSPGPGNRYCRPS